jgi:hypothetical protein
MRFLMTPSKEFSPARRRWGFVGSYPSGSPGRARLGRIRQSPAPLPLQPSLQE